MLNSINSLPSNQALSHPNFSNLNAQEKKQMLHRLLLSMAKDESEKEVKSVYRKTADFVREMVYGKTESQIKAAIFAVLDDYFDGEVYQSVEIDNLVELTGCAESVLQPVLDQLVEKGEILLGRRRRYQEYGEHYNALYKKK